MLVLSRKVGEELVIGDNIRIVISAVAGNRVSVGIEAPRDVHIVRGELKAIRDEFAAEPAQSTSQQEGPITAASACDSTSFAPRCAR